MLFAIGTRARARACVSAPNALVRDGFVYFIHFFFGYFIIKCGSISLCCEVAQGTQCDGLSKSDKFLFGGDERPPKRPSYTCTYTEIHAQSRHFRLLTAHCIKSFKRNKTFVLLISPERKRVSDAFLNDKYPDFVFPPFSFEGGIIEKLYVIRVCDVRVLTAHATKNFR